MFLSRKNIAAIAIGVLTACACMPHAMAQEVSDKKDRVAEPFGFRNISPFKNDDINVDPFEYRGDPVKFNSFLIWPNLTLKQEYNDNVLATENNTESDFATIIEPEITVQKQVGRHNFLGRISSEIRRYWDLTNENVENYRALFQANLEARKTLNIPIKIEYMDEHLERKNQKRANVNELSTKPLGVQSFETETGVIYKPNRLELSFLGNYTQKRLDNAERFNGAPLIRENRDLDAAQFSAQASYEMPAGFVPFMRAEISEEDYVNESAGAVSRDNNNVRILLGSAFDYKGLLYGFMSAGYETRSYDDSRVSDADGLALRGKVTWVPQAKTQISLDLLRETFEDNVIIAGITETYAAIELQHELQKDLFLKLGTSFQNEDFNDTDREDDTFGAKASVVYIANSHLQFGAEYEHTTRDSTVNGLGLDNNIVMLRATAAW